MSNLDSEPQVDVTPELGVSGCVFIEAIPMVDLHELASCEPPVALQSRYAADALPPAFVAERALEGMRGGKPYRWCSTFYIRDGDGSVVGGCGFKDTPCGGTVEIGYAVSPERRGRGIATAAIRQLLTIAFESGEVSEVLAQVSETNIASTRVVQKLGFSSHGTRVDADGERLVQWSLFAE